MTGKYSPTRLPSGTVIQGGIPKVPPDPNANKPNGLLVRGVVIATYVLDDDAHPYKDDRWETVGIYCDVLIYSGMPRGRANMLPNVLVPQSRGGMHNGHIWKPKAAKLDVTGNSLNTRVGTNPADMDGDHVLIGFMDNDFTLPVILGGVPHPRADKGNEEAGRHLMLKLEDGDPDFWKHHGTLYGVDQSGNFVIDTRFANGGDTEDDGSEVEQNAGDVMMLLPADQALKVEVDGELQAEVGGDGLSDDQRVAIAKLVKDEITALRNSFNDFLNNNYTGHMHPSGMGPTGNPLPAPPVVGPGTVGDVHAEMLKAK